MDENKRAERANQFIVANELDEIAAVLKLNKKTRDKGYAEKVAEVAQALREDTEIARINPAQEAFDAAFAEVVARLPDRLGRPKTMPDLLLALDQWRERDLHSVGFDKGVRYAFNKVRDLCHVSVETSPDGVLARVAVSEEIARGVAQALGTSDPGAISERLAELLDNERWILALSEVLGCVPEREKISSAIARAADRSRLLCEAEAAQQQLLSVAVALGMSDGAEGASLGQISSVIMQAVDEILAEAQKREEELEAVVEQLGTHDSLSVAERAAELIAELEDVRIKMRVAFEMLGAARALLEKE